MQTIVLITRENSERVTHVSVFLCSNHDEAAHFCRFANHLSLAGEDKLVARRITANAEYPLEKFKALGFDDLVNVDDRAIQRLLRELDAQVLALALTEAKEWVKDKFFRNMSKRSSLMLEEDIVFLGPVNESDIENARHLTMDIYYGLPHVENRLEKIHEKYKALDENNANNSSDSDGKNHIVLLFRGVGAVADYVSVFLFDEYDSADNFCNYLNNLKPDKDSFIYARHADQMIGYETTRPLLASFDQIFEISRVHGEWDGAYIIREAFDRLKPDIILEAFKGMDKRSRMTIMQILPTKTADAINDLIESSDKYYDLSSPNSSRRAQQHIINAINKTANKFKKERSSDKGFFIDN